MAKAEGEETWTIGAETGDISTKNSNTAPKGLTLAPSGDESLDVRFQELQTTAFPVTTKTNLFPSVPLGMEFVCMENKN